MLKNKLTRSIRSLKSLDIALLLILILALFFRLVGIRHGFPFISHPDEPSVVRSALGIIFEKNPKHFDWPHLYFYLNYFVFRMYIKFRVFLQLQDLRQSFESTFPLMWRDPLVFYYISRVLSAIFGALTVIPVYLSAKNLFGKMAARFSALALAILPFHIWHSHYALIDVPMTFFVAFALYFSTKIYQDSKISNYLLAGLFIGLATSTKYNAALACVVVILAHFLRVYNSKEKLITPKAAISLITSGLMSILGFVIGTPYSVLDYKTFIQTDSPKGALWQFTNVGDVTLLNQFKQFFNVIFVKLLDDMGYTFMVLFVVFSLLYVFNVFKTKKIKDNQILLVLIPALFILWYTAGRERTRSHYFMTIYPFFVILIGFISSYIWNLYHKSSKNLTALVLIVIYFIPFLVSTTYAYTFTRESTLNILYTWLQDNTVEDDYIIYNDEETKLLLDRLPNDRTKKVDTSIVESRKGYLVLSVSDGELDTYLSDEDDYLEYINLEQVKPYELIDSSYRTGPNYLIYSFGDIN